MCGAGSDALRRRSERERERGMLTGSTMIGGSSISLFMGVISEEDGVVSADLRDLSSLSRFSVRNLLDLRGCFEVDGVGVSSEDELPLARLVTLLAGSVTDLARSRIACFWRNRGSLEEDWD